MLNSQKLDEAEEKILPSNSLPGDVSEYGKYLNMTSNEVNRLSATDALNISLRLNQYALYIQRCVNKENTNVMYLKHRIKTIISKSYSKYKGSWEYQEQQAINESPEAVALNDALVYHSGRLERLTAISLNIKNISENFKNIYYDKKRTDRIPD